MSRLFYICLLSPLIIPPVVFSICALEAGLSFSDTLTAVFEQYTVRRQNLLTTGLPGFFPILLLLGGLWLHRRSGGTQTTRIWMGWGGLIPIMAVIFWVNFQFWPLFLPARTYPGFPHGMEFIIGPGFFAPVGMLLGMLLGWWLARDRR